MKISARNQIAGKITSIEQGSVNGIVVINYGAGEIVSTISLAAIKDLDLQVGDQVTAIIKATDVMIGQGELKLSARNQLHGTVTSIEPGAVNGIVALSVNGDQIITATISKTSIEKLGLEIGGAATAVIKATSVMVAK